MFNQEFCNNHDSNYKVYNENRKFPMDGGVLESSRVDKAEKY
jgi:hypothetical protein